MQHINIKPKKIKRKLRVRKKVSGTGERPRLSVFRSNKYTIGQLIDDITGKTLVSLSLNEVKKLHDKKTKTEGASAVGKELAKLAKKAKINEIVFDRNGYKYHGRVKALADGAREEGLQF